MKFPLLQTAKRHWAKKDDQTTILPNKRPVADDKLTAIALCSTRGFEAVQIYKSEIRAQDFLYFLNKSIANLPPNKKYTILLDNATWHTVELINKTEANKFLFFNVPHMFQLNLIENAFSFIRHEFRKRHIVDGLESEAYLVMNMFFEGKNRVRFKGIYRNHLRMLIKYFNLCKEGQRDAT